MGYGLSGGRDKARCGVSGTHRHGTDSQGRSGKVSRGGPGWGGTSERTGGDCQGGQERQGTSAWPGVGGQVKDGVNWPGKDRRGAGAGRVCQGSGHGTVSQGRSDKTRCGLVSQNSCKSLPIRALGDNELQTVVDIPTCLRHL